MGTDLSGDCRCPGCDAVTRYHIEGIDDEGYIHYRIFCRCEPRPSSHRKSGSDDRGTEALGNRRHVESELVSPPKAETKEHKRIRQTLEALYLCDDANWLLDDSIYHPPKGKAEANKKLVAFRKKVEREYRELRAKNEPPLLDKLKRDLDKLKSDTRI